MSQLVLRPCRDITAVIIRRPIRVRGCPPWKTKSSRSLTNHTFTRHCDAAGRRSVSDSQQRQCYGKEQPPRQRFAVPTRGHATTAAGKKRPGVRRRVPYQLDFPFRCSPRDPATRTKTKTLCTARMTTRKKKETVWEKQKRPGNTPGLPSFQNLQNYFGRVDGHSIYAKPAIAALTTRPITPRAVKPPCGTEAIVVKRDIPTITNNRNLFVVCQLSATKPPEQN